MVISELRSRITITTFGKVGSTSRRTRGAELAELYSSVQKCSGKRYVSADLIDNER